MSSASASPSAVYTSNTNETSKSVPSAHMASKTDSAHSGGASRTHTSPQEEVYRGGIPKDVVLHVEHPKNNAIRGALEKLQQGIVAKRVTTEYLMEGIRKWIDEKRGSVIDSEQEETFVKYVWHHMRQKQRDTAAAIAAERLQRGLDRAKEQLAAHYAEFPDESKSDEELVTMFRKLNVWSSVVSSEQRRIASKKRHEKEERLIHEKFCGDREAYNRWKALNEKVSLGYVRDVSPQLLIEFANWFQQNPDFLYPGSKDISVSSASHRIQKVLSMRDIFPEKQRAIAYSFDVSKGQMLPAISDCMDNFVAANARITLKFGRSPKEFTMTDKYPLLNMHNCRRLLHGDTYPIVAINDDKLVFEETSIMYKRLPDEFHKQLKGHCEREGLFQELECHRVFEFTPGLIATAEIYGHTAELKYYRIRLRLSCQANKTFDFKSLRMNTVNTFTDQLRNEAKSKREKNQARANNFSLGPSQGIAKQLLQLGQMHKDGLLTKEEFEKAKADLF